MAWPRVSGTEGRQVLAADVLQLLEAALVRRTGAEPLAGSAAAFLGAEPLCVVEQHFQGRPSLLHVDPGQHARSAGRFPAAPIHPDSSGQFARISGLQHL